MCALHLTRPSAHTVGAWAADAAAPGEQLGIRMPCSSVSPQSWTIPAEAEIRTHNLGLKAQRSIH